MAKVKINMIVLADLDAWGPGARAEDVPQLHLDYEAAAQEVAERIWPDHEIEIDIEYRNTMHGSAFATLYDDDGETYWEDVDLDTEFDFSARVWDCFCTSD